ncbi:MAG TPA: penicillin-binding transpeptidase domain-containing protein, partial [Sphingomicrobium sp.]|nr:penicillin-binding transpeptidase domain-containing protein [Sphingomicrobium sp.]
GWTPDSIIEDEPITIGDWTPTNSDGVYRGDITLREAFARSSNVAAVRLSEKVGRSNVIRAARDLGITARLPDKPSLALGTGGVSLIELTSAYAAILSGRYPVEARGLPGKEADHGLAGLFASSGRLDPRRDRAAMLDLLWAAANTGTGKRAALRVPTFGKTGTTQDNRDAVFVGFAGDLVVGVWVGRDDNSSLGKISGGTVPARIWRDFMSSALSVDRRQGPALPSTYRDRPRSLPQPPAEHPSPLPDEWSEGTRALREIADALQEVLDEK